MWKKRGLTPKGEGFMRNAILASVGIPLMESRYEKHYSGLHWLPLEGKLSAQLTDEVENS